MEFKTKLFHLLHILMSNIDAVDGVFVSYWQNVNLCFEYWIFDDAHLQFSVYFCFDGSKAAGVWVAFAPFWTRFGVTTSTGNPARSLDEPSLIQFHTIWQELRFHSWQRESDAQFQDNLAECHLSLPNGLKITKSTAITYISFLLIKLSLYLRLLDFYCRKKTNNIRKLFSFFNFLAILWSWWWLALVALLGLWLNARCSFVYSLKELFVHFHFVLFLYIYLLSWSTQTYFCFIRCLAHNRKENPHKYKQPANHPLHHTATCNTLLYLYLHVIWIVIKRNHFYHITKPRTAYAIHSLVISLTLAFSFRPIVAATATAAVPSSMAWALT